jgi:hypothetical protein
MMSMRQINKKHNNDNLFIASQKIIIYLNIIKIIKIINNF